MSRPLALVRQVPDSFADSITRRPIDPPLDVELARRQHAAYTAALAIGGYEVAVLEADHQHPDSVFIEDVAVVVDGRAILTRPGHPGRRNEVGSIAEQLAEHLDITWLRQGRIDGGDVLQVGDTVFVGRSTRTDDEGIAALIEAVGGDRRVVTVEVGDVLHLKSGVSAFAEAAVLWHPDACDDGVFEVVEVVRVEGSDPEAANVVRLPDGSVLVPAHHQPTATLLQARGVGVVGVDVSEFARADGGVTCLSLRTGLVG